MAQWSPRNGVKRLLRAVPFGYLKHWIWDLRQGVDTRGVVPTTAPHGVEYDATLPLQFDSLIQLLPQEVIHNSTFIDIGSGKGRVLLFAAAYQFRRIVGVEYSATLHEIAQRNIARYRGKRRCTQIEPINSDAAFFEFPSGPLVLFFNNPFGAAVMRPVVINIRNALLKEPRDLAILCVTRWTKTEIIETIPGLQIWSKGPAHAVYFLRAQIS